MRPERPCGQVVEEQLGESINAAVLREPERIDAILDQLLQAGAELSTHLGYRGFAA